MFGGRWGAVGSAEEVSRLPYLDLYPGRLRGASDVVLFLLRCHQKPGLPGQMIDDTSFEQGERLQAPNHTTLGPSPKDGPAAILGWTPEAWTCVSSAIHSTTVWTADPITHGLWNCGDRFSLSGSIDLFWIHRACGLSSMKMSR